MITKDPTSKPFGGREPKPQTTEQQPLPQWEIEGIVVSGTARRLIQEQAMQLIGVEVQSFVLEGDYGRLKKARVPFDPAKHRPHQRLFEVREYLIGPVSSTYAAHMPQDHSRGIHCVIDGRHIGGIGAKLDSGVLRRCALTAAGEAMLRQMEKPQAVESLVE